MPDIAGPLLVRAGLITQAQLVAAHRARTEAGGVVCEHLILSGAIDEEVLVNFFRERLLVPPVGLAELARVPSRVIARVPAELAAEFRVVPIDFDREQNLILAMADPSDTHAIDEVGFFTGAYVMRAVAPPTAIAWALEQYYGVKTPLARAVRTAKGSPPEGIAAAVPTEISETPSGTAVLVDHARIGEAESVPAAVAVAIPAPVPVSVSAALPAPASLVGDDGGAKVLVSLADIATEKTEQGIPEPKRLPPAMIVDDAYGEDTPLPRPVPFDTTGSSPKFSMDELTVVDTSRPAHPSPMATMATLATDPATTFVPPPGEVTIEAAPPPVAQAASAPAPSPETDAALTSVLEALRIAADRDGIAEAVVDYLGRLCRRTAFFVVRKGALCGWTGKGKGVHQKELRRAALPLEAPSTFRDIVQMRLPFRGPVIDNTSRDFLIDALGWAPETMLVAPVTVRDKVVSLLYGDGGEAQVPDEDLAQVARAASQALERALAARKGQ